MAKKTKTKEFKFTVTVKVNLDDLPGDVEIKKSDVAEMIDSAISEYQDQWLDEATGGPTGAGEPMEPEDNIVGWIAYQTSEVKVK